MRDEWKLTARLVSLRVLKQYMDHRQIKTGYALATKAGILPGTVNHILSGRRKSCSPETAAAIERALDVVPESLFVLEKSKVADALRPSVKAAA